MKHNLATELHLHLDALRTAIDEAFALSDANDARRIEVVFDAAQRSRTPCPRALLNKKGITFVCEDCGGVSFHHAADNVYICHECHKTYLIKKP